MEKELAEALKDWLFDRYQGFNNDDSHSWKIGDLIQKYEKKNGPLKMQGWRSREQFTGEKTWWDAFPEED